MWVPPRLRRQRPSPMSSADMSMDPWGGPGVFGVGVFGVGGLAFALAMDPRVRPGALGVEVSWALVLALALASGVPLLFPDPRPKGVAPALAIW